MVIFTGAQDDTTCVSTVRGSHVRPDTLDPVFITVRVAVCVAKPKERRETFEQIYYGRRPACTTQPRNERAGRRDRTHTHQSCTGCCCLPGSAARGVHDDPGSLPAARTKRTRSHAHSTANSSPAPPRPSCRRPRSSPAAGDVCAHTPPRRRRCRRGRAARRQGC